MIPIDFNAVGIEILNFSHLDPLVLSTQLDKSVYFLLVETVFYNTRSKLIVGSDKGKTFTGRIKA